MAAGEKHAYPHFCALAQAMERLGERWGLLVVRDLLPGERRFTDLMETCAGITPRQLSARLRQLESAGIVERRSRAGRREVRYRLTPAGLALRPAVETLMSWGVAHLARPPGPNEPVNPYHLMTGTRLAAESAQRQPAGPVRWSWVFDDEPYTLRFDGRGWALEPGRDPAADVQVVATPRAWATFAADRVSVARGDRGIRLVGSRRRLREINAVFPRLHSVTDHEQALAPAEDADRPGLPRPDRHRRRRPD